MGAYDHYSHSDVTCGKKISPKESRRDVREAFTKHVGKRRALEKPCDSQAICKHSGLVYTSYFCDKCGERLR